MERHYIETKLHSKETFKQIIYQKLIKNRYHNKHDFFVFKNTHPNKYVKVASVFHRNCIKKKHQNNVIFFVDIRSKKVHRNDVNISLINIVPKKGCQNNVDISPIENASKWYLKTTSTFLPLKLHLESTSKWRGNSSIVSIWCINLLLTSDQRHFDLLCPLGSSELCSP